MPPTDAPHLLLAALAAFLAGAINSIAGGGTMISFPTLFYLGLPAITANATNTVGIWPGSLGSILGFRRELKAIPKPFFSLLLPATLGGITGAILLRLTPSNLFNFLVPWLILFATLLFLIQTPVRKKLEAAAQKRPQNNTHPSHTTFAFTLQFLVGIYGGYFGAGISIMMLAVLGIIGMTDILQMNAMTSLLSLAINGIAGILFIALGLIAWPFALTMAAASLLGGYLTAKIARNIPKPLIRYFIILIGLTLALAMFYKLLFQ